MTKLLGFLAAIGGLFKPIVYAIIFWMGRRAGRQEAEASIIKNNAEKQERYAEIASEPRTAADTVGRMRDKQDF